MRNTIEILPEELPDWMRLARRGVDWGVLLVVAFSLTIAMPFITQANLPHTNASENYVYRSADYATALQEGRLYPRWSANVLGGYGAPVPHYFPPGAGYAAASLQVLFTDDPVLAVRLVYIIALGMAGAMLYLFVTRRTGAGAGLIAGMIYVYSPYIGLTAPHILGDLPGVMTFALMPALLWSIDRLLIRNLPLDILLVALTTCALYLTSFRGAIVSTVLAVILILWHWRTVKARMPWARILMSYVLGVGIAGFFWIPALLEQDVIQWRTTAVVSSLSLRLDEFVAPVRQIDTGELVYSPQFTLGLTTIAFAIAGLISVFRFRATAPFQAIFIAAGVGLAVTALLALPHETWLMGAITLCFSIGGSAVIQWRAVLPKQGWRLFLPSLLILIWILATPVWLVPITTEVFGSADSNTQVQYEQQGYGVAVLPPGQPIPSTVGEAITPNRFLLDGYQFTIINKIAPSQLPANAQAGLLDHNSHNDRFQIRTDTPIRFNILTAYFPGWRATIDNQPTPLTRDAETGFMQVDVPALSGGELLIVLGSTAVRTGSWLISWCMLLIAIIITWGRFRRHRSTFEDLEQLSYKEARLIGVVLASIAIIIYLFNNPGFPLSLRARPGYVLENSTLIQSRTDTGLNLLAFRLENNQYRGGGNIDLTLYWQAQRFLTENYQVRVQLVNNQNRGVWSPTPLRHPGNYPTRRWKTGLYVTDDYDLPLAPNTEPGNYQIQIEVFDCNPDCSSGSQATFFNVNGQVLGTDLTLPTLVSVSG